MTMAVHHIDNYVIKWDKSILFGISALNFSSQ